MLARRILDDLFLNVKPWLKQKRPLFSYQNSSSLTLYPFKYPDKQYNNCISTDPRTDKCTEDKVCSRIKEEEFSVFIMIVGRASTLWSKNDKV
jgi:hypothetical protein